jgi:transcriptional regulator with XRE-family HTH domain
MTDNDMDSAADRKTVLGLFAASVRVARARRKWTQAQVAARAGTTADRVSGIESGNVDPRLSTVARIAEALGIQVTITENAA